MANFTHSKTWKNFMAKLYGIGAAVVILGALFKIQHWEGSGVMLTVGLGTEAIIFFFSAFEPLPHEYDWSLVYPEFAGMFDEEKKEKKQKKDPIVQELDRLMQDAKIGPELIQSLGAGLKSLGDNTSKLADLQDATVATNDYVKNVNSASKSVTDLASTSHQASAAMSALSTSSATIMNELSTSANDMKSYNSQMGAASKNLSALNAVYELQLQDANDHFKMTNKFYDGINNLMSNLNESIDDTKKYKDEVRTLAKNLAALNTVYGNMLSAMSSTPKG